MKNALLYAFTIFLGSSGYAQQNTVAAGGEASGTGGTVSYSIGQVDYINAQGTNGSVNQGVQQPFEFYPLGLGEETFAHVTLFPNPTNEFIILQFETITNGLSYLLYDGRGRLLANGNIEQIETQIDMRAFTSGEYTLSILNGANKIQSIKIIKN
ncbi:MAG: hypothetical protein ACI837_002817 [Crocinitomicaceae bacterium]|jgi:hypothetical protein